MAKKLAGPGVTADRLEVLCNRELRELCAKFGRHISTRANKSDIVATLLDTNLSLGDMSAEQLIRICREVDVPIGTGYKADVIERLVNATNRVRDANQSEEAGSKVPISRHPQMVKKVDKDLKDGAEGGQLLGVLWQLVRLGCAAGLKWIVYFLAKKHFG